MLNILSMSDSRENKKILVVDSGKNNLDKMLDHFGFEIRVSVNPEKIIDEAKKFGPNLIVGDFFNNHREGLISDIREDASLSNLPVILCAEKKNIASVIRKINGNVNDYLVRPFGREEVAARIERVLKRHENVLNTNPLSHLPGNISIKTEYNKLIERQESFSMIYLDLDNFKAFNDYYGYSKGDEVIKFVADLCKFEAHFADRLGFDNFVGHIGGDDFVIIRSAEKINEFCENFILQFDQRIRNFYQEEDISKGFIRIKDRKGKVTSFPIMSISMAVVINRPENSFHFGEISRRGSEIKKYLKLHKGSNFLVDRRTGR